MNYGNKVLVVDDEQEMCKLLKETLDEEGFQVVSATSGQQALRVFAKEFFPVVVLDIVMEDQDIDGLILLKEIRKQRPETKVIMLTAYASIDSAIEALRLGAFDYLRKGPQIWKEIPIRVRKAFEDLNLNRQNIQLRRELERTRGFAGMIGTSPPMQKLYQTISQVAVTDATVLIRGETGTGKELVAKAIHDQSSRKGKPFVVVDCNIPETLTESELFGVTKDYPGFQRKEVLIGQFELADGGTLLLDEVGDLSLSVQAKLLRSLQEREIRPLGAQHAIRVDVRVIAATNRNLEQAMKNGQFREDLFHRLNVVIVEVPPLRERKEDILQLVQHFLEKDCGKLKRPIPQISDGALNAVLDYNYPGNVRELENIIERAIILSSDDIILPEAILVTAKREVSQDLMQSLKHLRLSEVHSTLEKTYLELLLQETQGNISQAAKKAGIARNNFKQKLRKHNINVDSFRS